MVLCVRALPVTTREPELRPGRQNYDQGGRITTREAELRPGRLGVEWLPTSRITTREAELRLGSPPASRITTYVFVFLSGGSCPVTTSVAASIPEQSTSQTSTISSIIGSIPGPATSPGKLMSVCTYAHTATKRKRTCLMYVCLLPRPTKLVH